MADHVRKVLRDRVVTLLSALGHGTPRNEPVSPQSEDEGYDVYSDSDTPAEGSVVMGDCLRGDYVLSLRVVCKVRVAGGFADQLDVLIRDAMQAIAADSPQLASLPVLVQRPTVEIERSDETGAPLGVATITYPIIYTISLADTTAALE